MDNDPVDYADFAYQHIRFNHVETGDNSARSFARNSVEPLEDKGGLSTTEAAELVALRLSHTVNADYGGVTVGGDPGGIDFRGVVGSDVGARDLLPDQNGNNTTSDIELIEGQDNSDIRGNTFSHSNSNVFANFNVKSNPVFDDDTSGAGGGGSAGHEPWYTLNFREMVGRGPVMTSGDDLGQVSVLVKNDVQGVVESVTSAHAIWDIVELEDADDRFSIPNQ